MSATKQKQIRMSEEGRFLLNACKQGTGYTDTQVMENCIAMHALGLRQEVRRAKEFLYENIVNVAIASRVSAARVHRSHPQPAIRPHLKKKSVA